MNCKNSGSRLVAADHQGDPGAGSDAPDPHHLASEVDQPVLLQENPPIGLKRLSVLADELVQALHYRLRMHVAGEVFDAFDQWRVSHDLRLAVHHLSQLRKGGHAVLRARLGRRLLGALELGLLDLASELGEQLVHLKARIPHIQAAHARELAHRIAVAGDRLQQDRAALLVRIAVVAPRHLHAHRQPLDVPLPRPRKRLIKVVEVKHHPSIRGRKQPEVGQVRVTAELHMQPRVRARRQVGGHDQGRPAIERKRRDQHPPIADRHQLRNPRRRLRLQQLHRIGTVRSRAEICVARPRHLTTRRASPRRALCHAQMRHHLRSLWRPRAADLSRGSSRHPPTLDQNLPNSSPPPHPSWNQTQPTSMTQVLFQRCKKAERPRVVIDVAPTGEVQQLVPHSAWLGRWMS